MTVENESTQTVLISLVGTTPAVLTETVWALANSPEPIVPDRIIAVTTAPGAERIKEKLFSEDQWKGMLATLSGRDIAIEEKLRFGPIGDSIRVFPNLARNAELDDIRSADDNKAVAEFFMELIRSFTENESTRLIVSIAGGRKTTSALLHSVMTLLGRAQDQINHILINDEWISQPDFLYPGCPGVFVDQKTGNSLSSEDAELQLVDVPFVPLRYLFSRDLDRSAGSFVDLMNQVRTKTINVDDDLLVQIDTKKGSFRVNDREISLSDKEFLLYLFFALRVEEGQGKVGSYAEIEDALKDLREHYLKDHDKDFGHWSQVDLGVHFDAGEECRKWASTIRTKLKSADFQAFQIDRLVPAKGNLAIDLPPESLEIDV